MQKLVAIFSFGTAIRVNESLGSNGLQYSSIHGAYKWFDHYFFSTGIVTLGDGGRLDDRSRYVSLVRCAHSLAVFVRENWVKEVVVICAPQCRWRLRHDLAKLLPKGVKVAFEKSMWDKPAWMFYSKESEHPQTRSAWRWWPYEAMVLAVNLISWRTYAKKAGLTDAELSQVGL